MAGASHHLNTLTDLIQFIKLLAPYVSLNGAVAFREVK
jgi:hypothetical protein